MHKVFMDANVLLDVWLARGNYENAEKVVELISNGSIKAYWTTSIIHICSYWLKKQYGYAETKEILLIAFDKFLLVDAVESSVRRAITSNMNDIEDALQYYAALDRYLDYFISNDKKLKNSALPLLPVITPTQFLERL